MHPDGNFFVVQGVKLWCETEGKGEPIVLIPGGPGYSHSMYHPYFSELAARHQIIYYDPFGCGKSDRASSPAEYSFERSVTELEGLREALGIPSWNVLGQSYGGLVAQAYALQYPASVKRLCLFSTWYCAEMGQAGYDNMHRGIADHFPDVWERTQAVRAKGLRASHPEHRNAYTIPAAFLHHNQRASSAFVGDFNDDLLFKIFGDDAGFVLGGDVARFDFRDKLASLDVPILILIGRFDRLVIPRLAVHFQAYAPRAHFYMMEHSGHLAYVDETRRALRILDAFLTQT